MHYLPKNYVQIVLLKYQHACSDSPSRCYVKKTCLITSRHNFHHSAIYGDFLYYLLLILCVIVGS